MTRFSTGAGGINVTLTRDRIDVTSDRPTPNEQWRYTDKNGHEHRYERGFQTLDLVVDAEHWCDGTEGIYNHDPHMAVDEAHYECLICREVIEPAMDAPGWPKSIPGMVSCTVDGLRSDGAMIEAWVTEDEARAIPGMDAVAQQRFIDGLPDDRITSIKFSR